jgi:hypothetical protein
MYLRGVYVFKRGKSIEEWGIGNGHFRFIGNLHPKIEGLIRFIE